MTQDRQPTGNDSSVKSATPYDDDEALTNYVLDNYGQWVTPLERRVLNAIQAEEKANACDSERLSS